jgi:hypothetical protein
VSGSLPNPSSWVDGTPPERALVAWFASVSPAALEEILRRINAVAIKTVAPEPARSLMLALNDTPVGPRPLVDAEWDFPGGSSLMDALEAAQASKMRPVLESLGHALAAVGDAVGAVLESRVFQRDPRLWREAYVAELTLHQRAAIGSLHSDSERREVWCSLLEAGRRSEEA